MKLQKQLLKMQKNYLDYKKIPIKKSWGQNFLIDENIIKKIIKIINPNENSTIIEIGPGKGALTIPISKIAKKVYAVEVDPLLYEFLKTKNIKNLCLYNEDILKWNFDGNHDKNVTIIGNLPYYISSPIIFKFLNTNYWKDMIIMVQKEVGKRITSKHKSKDYSRISVMCQTFFKTKYICDISKNVFIPKPKVSSSILSFQRKKTTINIEKYSAFIKIAFSNRRKTIKNNFKKHIDVELLNGFKNKRADEITVDEYKKLFNKIYLM